MKTPSFLSLAVATSVLALAACQDSPSPTEVAPGSVAAARASAAGDTNVIVVLRSGLAAGGHEANRSRAAAVARDMGLAPAYAYGTALFGFAAAVPRVRLDALARDPRVAMVSPDGEVFAVGQTLPTGIDRIDADQSSQKSGDGSGAVTGVGVAIIDTGIDPDHPDLDVAGGYNCATGRSWADANGHGTHVAGTVAAKDDGNGVVGVAPGAPLYAVRVLNNSGTGRWSAVACGIDWVTANASALGIKVANMSLSGRGSDGACSADALHTAICNSVAAGVTYVVAASNEGVNFSGYVPAAYDQVLTVTAIADFNGLPGGGAAPTCGSGVDDSPANFSNYTTVGSADAAHTIAAPGVCILSTWRNGGYATMSGTSMATPHVTGTVALCIASGACAGRSPSQIVAKLRSDAQTKTGAGGYGFVGDPTNPLGGGRRGATQLYYGYLTYAGGY